MVIEAGKKTGNRCELKNFFPDIGTPLQLNTELLAMTDEPDMPERSVIVARVMPSV